MDGIARDTALNRAVDTAASGGRTLFTFRAEGSGTEGVRTDLTVRGHDLVVDEPPGLGGDDAGPSPLETALAALASCQVVTYRLWAARWGLPLDGITVEVEGDLDVHGFYALDDRTRAGFGAVRLRVRLDGPAAPERYRELAAHVDAHCPVLDLFTGATPVTAQVLTSPG